MKPARARPPRPTRAATRPPETPLPFHAFIAYDDVAAARGAMTAINEVLRAAPRPHGLRPMLWRAAQLTSAHWEEASLREAIAADVVVLAFTGRSALSPAIETWVAQLLARKRGARITVVALLGEDDAWTISIEVPATRAMRPAEIAPLASPSVVIESHAA